MANRAMSDSNVQWMGDIPNNWSVEPIGKLFTERNTKVSDLDFPPLSVTKKGIVPQLENAAKSKNHNDRKQVNSGDFVINSRSDRKMSSGLSSLDGSVSLINIVLTSKSVFPGYTKYLLKNYGFAEEFYRWGTGIVADLWSTRYERMKRILVPYPSYEEQQKIATFLDEKVSHIDNIIEDTKKSIENLKAYKQSLITETVIKGLNPDVEMKDSGIEWIGQIPKEWIVTSINTLCFVTKLAGFEYTKYINEGISDEGEVPLVRAQNIKMGRFIEENFNYIDKALSIKLNRSALYKKSLLITFIGAGIGEVALFNKSERYHLAPNVAKIEVTKNGEKYISEEYLLYYLMSQSGQEEVNKIKKATAQPSLSMETIRTIKITVPSDMTIQKEISDYLFIKTKHINNLVNQKNLIITELETYKQSLIYEYVTGKKEVK